MGVSASGVCWAFLAARALAGLIEYFVVTRVCERCSQSIVFQLQRVRDSRDKHTVVGLASRSCAERVSHSCDDSIKGIVAAGL